MASSLLTLLDDIATTLDDVALMTKVATKKTVGVLGDDLAVNADQVGGARADRELPIVLAVAKGSAVNKLILVPLALAISQLTPWLVTPLLMAGGLYLCIEGFEKVYEKFAHKKHGTKKPAPAAHTPELEKARVKGAVRTDFILSAEIVVLSLGTVVGAPLIQQLITLVGISAIMTVGVYGVVAMIVRLDDLGLLLKTKRKSEWLRSLGGGILGFAPLLMKFLAVAGTLAMFSVGGGILVHGIPPLHHVSEGFGGIGGTAFSFAIGILAGGLGVALLEGGKKMQLRKSLPFLRWSFIRLGLGMKKLEREWQVGDGREDAALKWVIANSKKGDLSSVISAIDEFAYKHSFLINVGDEKGKIMDAAIAKAQPKLALELGAYVGYSALRTARMLKPGARLLSIEFSEANAAIARQMIAHAGVSDRVTVVHGYIGDGGRTVERLEKEFGVGPGSVDFIFVDHAKDAYLPDLKTFLAKGWLHKGSVVVADNVKFPGAPDYHAFMNAEEGRSWKTVEHKTHAEYQTLIKDLVLESTYLG